jgi:D-beta-D-heptose 7-phosphate kinase/D-beta-D-heptose 1-phosphate adenosyltransferase
VRLLVVGDALLDRDLDGTVERLAPDAPIPVVDDPVGRARPGGAGLAAALAAADGADVTLVTALAPDAAGAELRALLAERGVAVVDVGLDGRTPEKVRVRAGGRALLRLDHGGPPGTVGPLNTTLPAADAVLVADYGRGVAASPSMRAALESLPNRMPLVWDPHPRGPAPTAGVRLATPNEAEAARLVPGPAVGTAATLATLWGASGVAVTLGARGAVLGTAGGTPLVVPAPAVTGGDPCGAGDRFASAAALALGAGAVLSEAVEAAVVAASAFVAAGGSAGVPTPSGQPPAASVDDLVARVRSRGGTVVATGGCFDLLHAGHVATLKAARGLGDCLVVCLNSDASVRRLKGPDRPLQSETDRASLLLALDCVDAVVVFDEDTPEAALARFHPDLFAKGGDYAATELPEARTMAGWGGHAVALPYLAGRSTTRLLEEALRRAAP